MIEPFRKKKPASTPMDAAPRFPGELEATDGSTAVVAMETAASEAAGAYPITPSTQMGEGWAQAVAAGQTNVNGRRLLFFEPEGEHAAAAVTAGMSMMGLRATNFSSGQGIAYMHESLYAAAGKRLTYVLNVAARAMTKQALNVHAGHDDYHAVDDSGFFQLFAKNVQEAADLTLIAHRIAELSLTPGISAQDGFLTSHVIESFLQPERALVKTYLGDPGDIIDSPTPAQRLVYGPTRRRIPELFDFDYPAMFGVVQNQESYAQGVAAQRPFYFDHVAALSDQAMAEYAALTGREYARASGYLLDDAEYVLAGQGSVVWNAEAVADHLRRTRGLKVGVLNLAMFRPFPADRVSALLKGKKAVTVLERVDQPLAVDPPLLREIRAAMAQALENGRARNGAVPHAGVASLRPEEMPDFHAAGFGFGSRDLQPGDLVAAVDNMLEGGAGRRHYYLGIDFIDRETRAPKLQIWQQELLDAYPDLERLALPAAGDIDLLPEDSIAIRIHSVGGWGAITMGKNLALTAFELAGLHVKANPKYGSEKKGQPTNFYAVLAREPIRINAELKHVDVVLSPDPNVFRSTDPLAGLNAGGAFVIQSDLPASDVWASLPAQAQRTIVSKGIKVYALDAFKIASEEATDPELRYRMQGVAFMGAFFRVSPLAEREGLGEEALFAGIREQIEKKFGKLGQRVVDDNLRVIRRGFDELRDVPHAAVGEDEPGAHPLPGLPSLLDVPGAKPGIGNPGRFWEQVCAYCATTGKDVIADPFAAHSAIPAATSTVRDMTNIRFEVPDFVADKCTGCSQCWMQCPDAAIPGLVTSVEDALEAAIRTAANGKPLNRLKPLTPHLAKESRKILQGVGFRSFADAVSAAYENVAGKLKWDPERRKALDEEWAAVYGVVADFPFARTAPFYDLPEKKEKGTGGLLSITVNPEACKGCNICVDVCPEGALVTVRQDEAIVERLRRNWDLWENLPDTDDRYINVRNVEQGIGVLPTLLLKKKNYRSMAGGDGACMGCGEKTAVHILVSTIEGLMQPRAEAFVRRLDGLVAGLEEKARTLVAADADLDDPAAASGALAVQATPEHRERLALLLRTRDRLRDLRWRYVEGPGGRGRAHMGISNSTGCSSVWGSTYPYNPYPFPWVNHLFQDAPSIAIGIFEGQMRKMADNFVDVRRAELLIGDDYAPERDELFFEAFSWKEFSDEEFHLCPPVLAMGGDGAMLDIGFQNLSRLLASGKPIRVVVLDTQVYSNTGGQSCTSGFTGQVADMAGFGKAQHGKTETRKELSLIALAHRGAYVLQTSQAAPSHMMQGLLKGLNSRRPAVFNIYTPCPVEHGVADEWAPHSARLALESRAFPFLVYDPDEGPTVAECLNLDGNPSVEDVWPTYTLRYSQDGEERSQELPLTIADWAATEGRFKKHFRPLKKDEWDRPELVSFAELVALEPDDRVGKVPFIYTLGQDGGLERTATTAEMVDLADDRLRFWHQLKELAGLEVSSRVRQGLARETEVEFEARLSALKHEYEARLAELKASYPAVVARRLAEGLLAGGPDRTVAELLDAAKDSPPVGAVAIEELGSPVPSVSAAGAPPSVVAPQPDPVSPPAASAAAAQVAPPPVAESAPAEEDDDELVMGPYIETALCTSCNECININKRMFGYDDSKQAYIKDAKAGTFAELVRAAEQCPAGIIHPGTPLDPNEPDLDKWRVRAEPFQ
ncbi:MAG: 2-oxoacid:acceptor oxidoreductase family protein [Gemmatimonadota bacterium]